MESDTKEYQISYQIRRIPEIVEYQRIYQVRFLDHDYYYNN